MTNDKKQKKEIPKPFFNIYNQGKFGKILDSELNDSLKYKRIVSDENFATIKYVGSIPGSSGLWLGVDWDDATRGRHDGTFKGMKYFDTWSPKSGSFVRPTKASLGLTVEEALEIRYGLCEDVDTAYNLNEFYLESSDSDGECGTSGFSSGITKSHTHQKVKVHFSGTSNNLFNVNQGQMDRLKSAVLHSLPVFRCLKQTEEGNKVGSMVPLLEELDLAQTLITDWVEIAKICIQLPQLKQLNVSDNKLLSHLPITDENRKLLEDAFQRIVYLVLVRIYHSWEEFYQLFDYFPNIDHLCMAYNKLSSLNPCVHKSFLNITYLDLACNQISDFESDILPFGSLANLQTLLLNENKIESVIIPGKLTDDSDMFPKLALIAISNNRISSWESIHHLSRLKSLKELIFMFNPILEQQKNQETARQDVIAKLGRIKILNRNDVKYEERKGAEIDYLKRYGKKWLECQFNDDDTDEAKSAKSQGLDQFFQEHPRFLKLIDLYGAPEQSEMKEVSRKLKERLIEVVFEYPDLSGTIKSLKKKIPSHMTVQHIRSLLRRLCKFPAKSEFSLCYVSAARPQLEIPLEADTREIGFYNVEAGDHVIIHLQS